MSADLQQLRQRVTQAQANHVASQAMLEKVAAEAAQAGVVPQPGETLAEAIAREVSVAAAHKDSAARAFNEERDTLQRAVEEVEKCQRGN